LNPADPRVWNADTLPRAAYGEGSRGVDVTLTALNDRVLAGRNLAGSGARLVAWLPFYDGALGRQRAYTVEFRRKANWDQGLDMSMVVVHEIAADGHAVLVDDAQSAWTDGQTFASRLGQYRVTVKEINALAGTAVVNIGRVEPQLGGLAFNNYVAVNGWGFLPGRNVHLYINDRTVGDWVPLPTGSTVTTRPPSGCSAGSSCATNGTFDWFVGLPYPPRCGHVLKVYAIDDAGLEEASREITNACA
jgi:hypothetical protein